MKDVGELRDENAVRDHDAGHHGDAHQRHDVERAAGQHQDENHACEPGRDRHEDDERIDERGELRHQDQVDQGNRDEETKAKIAECLIHAHHGAAHLDDRVLVVLGVREQFVYLRAYFLQRFGFGSHVNVDHSANLVVIHFRRGVDLVDVGHRAERDRAGTTTVEEKGRGHRRGLPGFVHGSLRPRAPQWNVPQILHRHVVDPSVGILDRDQVVVAALGIDPVAGRDHAVRRKRGDDVVHHVLGGEPDQAGSLAIDVQREAGIVVLCGI